jgi:hypothetical protein
MPEEELLSPLFSYVWLLSIFPPKNNNKYDSLPGYLPMSDFKYFENRLFQKQFTAICEAVAKIPEM